MVAADYKDYQLSLPLGLCCLQSFVLNSTSTSTDNIPTNGRRLVGEGTSILQRHRKLAASWRGEGRQLAAAARIPVIEDTPANIGSDLARTKGPQQTLEDMLCAASRFTVAPDPSCKIPNYGMYKYQGQVFTPVNIPVTFHGECSPHLSQCTASSPDFYDFV